MSANAPVYPDPVVVPIKMCPACPHKMGDLRVHAGSSDAQHRGKIVQTCEDVANCHYTVYHTPAYLMQDARYLLDRIMARLIDPNAYPRLFLAEGAVLRLAPPRAVAPTAIGNIECANVDCVRGKSNKRTAGNRDCVGFFCKTCCVKDSQDCQDTGRMRLYCKAHRTPGLEGDGGRPNSPNLGAPPLPAVQPALLPPAPPPPAPLPPSAPLPPAPLPPVPAALPVMELPPVAPPQVYPPGTVLFGPRMPTLYEVLQVPAPPAAALHMAPPPTASIPQAQPAHPAPLPSTAVSVVPVPQLPAPLAQARPLLQQPNHVSQPATRPAVVRASPPSTPRRTVASSRVLAKPLGPLWTDEAQSTDGKRKIDMTQKAEAQQMELEAKKTVTFVVWHTDNTPPVYYPKYVPTHPKVRVRAITQFVANFRLTDESLVQWLQPHQAQWVCGDINSIIDIDSSNRVLVRLPPDPFTEWACPKLDTELQLLSRKILKRGGSELVSPLKKLPRVVDLIGAAMNGVQVSSRSLFGESSTRLAPVHEEPVTDSPIASSSSHHSEAMSESAQAMSIGQATSLPAAVDLPVAGPSSTSASTALPSTSMGTSQPPQSGETAVRARKWPSDFYVCEVAQGFRDMQALADRDIRKKQTQATRFEKVFVGIKFKRSTFNDNLRLWTKASEHLQDTFEAYGHTQAGIWHAFVAASRDTSDSDSNGGGNTSSSLDATSNHSAPARAVPPQSTSIMHDASATGCSATGVAAGERFSPTPSDLSSSRLEAPMAHSLQPEPSTQASVARNKQVAAPWPLEGMSPPRAAPPSLPIVPDRVSEDVEIPEDMLRELGLIPNLPGARLCEFCDEDVSFVHSEALIEMGRKLRQISWLDPTKGNPGHRAVLHWTSTFSYCERHRFERDILPLGRLRGWPDPVDFSALWTRLHRLRPRLNTIAANIAISEFYVRLKDLSLTGIGRARRDKILDDQTMGYYGGKGYQITHLVLMYFFPVEIANGLSELDYDALLANVLLQEAAVLLIQEDLGIDRAGAVVMLEESRVFGRHRYSGQDDDEVMHDVMLKIASIKKRDPSLLAEYRRTDSELDFLAWSKSRQIDSVVGTAPVTLNMQVRIKEEEEDISLDRQASGAQWDVSYVVVREGDKDVIVLDDE